jgi:hypothetical protein
MLTKLINMIVEKADEFDDKGLTSEADILDGILKKIADAPAMQMGIEVDQDMKDEAHRKGYDSVNKINESEKEAMVYGLAEKIIAQKEQETNVPLSDSDKTQIHNDIAREFENGWQDGMTDNEEVPNIEKNVF